jgi:hypothetical protein
MFIGPDNFYFVSNSRYEIINVLRIVNLDNKCLNKINLKTAFDKFFHYLHNEIVQICGDVMLREK